MEKVCVYYFSGTGNSLHVAKELQKLIPEADLIPIVSMMHKNKIDINAGVVGFVFPLYAFTLPPIVREFLKKVTISSSAYIFSIVTKGGSPSIVFEDINKILHKKGKELDSHFYIEMANNSIIFHGEDTEDEIIFKEKRLKIELEAIKKTIANRDKSCKKDPELSFFTEKFLFPIIGHTLFPALGGLFFSFLADSRCNGCGACAKVCLSNKIIIKEGKPHWSKENKCLFCFACINYCPVKAIQIKNTKTNRLGRYHHAEFSSADISKQKSEY